MIKTLSGILLILFFSHSYADELLTHPAISDRLSYEIKKAQEDLAKQTEEYQKRPWRKVAGVTIRGSVIDPYVKAWEQKVIRIFQMNFPKGTNLDNKHGTVMLTAAIKSDGSLESVNINRSSGYQILDKAIVKTVQLAAPFSNFSDEMLKQVDILEIPCSFTMSGEESQ